MEGGPKGTAPSGLSCAAFLLSFQSALALTAIKHGEKKGGNGGSVQHGHRKHLLWSYKGGS